MKIVDNAGATSKTVEVGDVVKGQTSGEYYMKVIDRDGASAWLKLSNGHFYNHLNYEANYLVKAEKITITFEGAK